MMITEAPNLTSRIDVLEHAVRRLSQAIRHGHSDRIDDEYTVHSHVSLSERETPVDIPWPEREKAKDSPYPGDVSTVWNLLHDAVIALDARGHVVQWNRSAERLLGWPAGEVLGVPPMFLPSALQSGPIESMTDSMTVCIRRDGSQILVKMSVANSKTGTVIVLHEIAPAPIEPIVQSDIANINDPEIQRTVTIGQLATGVAHDVNNLISIIGGYGQIIHEHLPPGDLAKELAVTISDMCHQAGDLLHYLTGRSKAGPSRSQRILIDELFGRLKRMIPRFVGNAHRTTILCHTGSAEIRGEAIELLRMVMNLVGNARSALPNGGEIVVEALVQNVTSALDGWPNRIPPGSYAVISVHDRGNGMAPEVMSHLFDTHFTTRSHEGGTGLGMSVVSTIVSAAHGHIQIQSNTGKGTSVNVFFPVCE